MTAPPKKPRLGGGLDALLPPSRPRPAPGAAQGFLAAIEDVHPSRAQPRKHFDEAALAELTASIGELGVLEPILVRRRAAGGLEIIAGERRWRAAQRAGLREVPVFVRDAADKEAFEAALVENLQREDLNPLEIARAYQRLVDEHGHTQETVAKRVGKDRSTVANALRLLKLPESVLARIAAGELSEGHGRALLAAGDVRTIERLALAAAQKRWSVRETERQAREAGSGEKAGSGGSGARAKGAGAKSANVRDLELRLSRALGTKVSVDEAGPGKGKITVPYSSLDELDRLLDKLLG